MWLRFQENTCNPYKVSHILWEDKHTSHEAPPSHARWEVLRIHYPPRARPLPPTQHSSPPGHPAFVPARQRAARPALHPRGSRAGCDPIRDQYPPLSPALSLPGAPPEGSRQTTVSPGTSVSGGTFEGKVHFINQPIVGLPSAGSSSPGVSLGAVDTDVNRQGCPPPLSLGVLQAQHKGLCRNAPHWPLTRTKIATPTELPKLDWILHHADWPWRLQLTRTGMADT